jgi:sulfate transport system ATP-binding protein
MQIDIHNVTKDYGSQTALRNIDLKIGSGELVALLGPSGSGKTTLLRLIAGLEFPNSGQIFFDADDASNLSVGKRNVGFVFQNYALFKHMRVIDNIAFGLRARPADRRPSEQEILSRARDLLSLVKLSGYEDRFPAQLSGGQQQRVALARALAIEPSVLLLDEPFGALDAKVRHELRKWLRELHDETGHTTVFVTHDQEEALDLADRVVVVQDGRIAQEGAPNDVYEEPASPFVYEFIGDVNKLAVSVKDGQVLLPGRPIAIGDTDKPDGNYVLYVRPHNIRVAAKEEGQALTGLVRDIRATGPAVVMDVSLDSWNTHLDIALSHNDDDWRKLKPGTRVEISLRKYALFPE